ncbi:MAG TPA: isochorismate synthase [Acidimicrobiia bacterium]
MRFVTRATDPVADPLARDPDHVWMSAEVSLWGWGEAARLLPGTGPARMQALDDAFSDLVSKSEVDDAIDVAGSGPVVFASVTFSPRSTGSVGVVPKVVVGRRGDTWWVTTADGASLPETVADPGAEDKARYAGSSLPDVLWLERVATAIERIRAGDVEKVVLARDYAVWSRAPFHPPRVLGRLIDRFPGCHVFRVADLVGASPELLVRRTGDRLDSLVLAGSAPSFTDQERDTDAARSLLGSDKDRWEHELAVRSVLEPLRNIGADVSERDEPEILRLANVQHLATAVTATVPDGWDALRLAELLHPTAAVGGTPTDIALELIDALEGMDRGRYAGPVGWMDRTGDGEFAIALRCAELSGARARLFAGAGIVSESLPEAELDETRLKLGAMMGALGAE